MDPRVKTFISYYNIIIKITVFKKRLIVYENSTENIIAVGAASELPWLLHFRSQKMIDSKIRSRCQSRTPRAKKRFSSIENDGLLPTIHFLSSVFSFTICKWDSSEPVVVLRI